MKKNYLRQIEQIILDHRDDCKLICPETCWCWDIETIIYQYLCRDYDELAEDIKKKIIELNKLQEEYREITGKEFKPFV